MRKGNRRKPEREVFDTAAAARRFVRATGRNVGHKDVDNLGLLVDLADAVEVALQDAVTQLHDVHGYSWARIALPLGITRQAAQQRFGGTGDTVAHRQVDGQQVLL